MVFVSMDAMQFSIVSFFLLVAVTVSNASDQLIRNGGDGDASDQLISDGGDGTAFSPAQIYWRTILPNTPIPKVIMDQLVAKGSKKAKSNFPYIPTYYAAKAKSNFPYIPTYYAATAKSNFPYIPTYYAAKAKSNFPYIPTYYAATAKSNFPYIPTYYATESDSKFPSDPALFFLPKDLHPGAAMNPGLSFIRTISDSTFLPRSQAEAIPFSSAKLSEILDRLSVLPGSPAASEVKQVLEYCEAAAAEGEHKHCATSLESLVDFVAAKLETHSVVVSATTVCMSTSSSTNEEAAPKQRYVVAPSGMKRMPGDKMVVCHPAAYPYSVYYCHLTRATRAYVGHLVGEDGTRVEAVAVCHSDTTKWTSVFFKVLGVKPGEPICHFLPQDHLIWTPTK